MEYTVHIVVQKKNEHCGLGDQERVGLKTVL